MLIGYDSLTRPHLIDYLSQSRALDAIALLSSATARSLSSNNSFSVAKDPIVSHSGATRKVVSYVQDDVEELLGIKEHPQRSLSIYHYNDVYETLVRETLAKYGIETEGGTPEQWRHIVLNPGALASVIDPQILQGLQRFVTELDSVDPSNEALYLKLGILLLNRNIPLSRALGTLAHELTHHYQMSQPHIANSPLDLTDTVEGHAMGVQRQIAYKHQDDFPQIKNQQARQDLAYLLGAQILLGTNHQAAQARTLSEQLAMSLPSPSELQEHHLPEILGNSLFFLLEGFYGARIYKEFMNGHLPLIDFGEFELKEAV